MARRVLVTRPEPGASKTARRLETMGFEPVLLPLTETKALPLDPRLPLDGLIAVAVTSANALRHAPPALVSALSDLPCHAVGKATAEAARIAGFTQVFEGWGNAERLAETIIQAEVKGSVGYLCGKVRRADFERVLLAAGVKILPVETYDTVEVSYLTDKEVTSILGNDVDAVLVYSTNAAKALLAVVHRPTVSHLIEKASFYCLSARISEIIAGELRGKIHVAAEPTEAALLSLLGRPD